MNHGSLFSGIGGFDLAAQWAGWRNVFQCEIDPWCQKVLAKNFPTTKRYGDIKQFNASEWRGRVDIISGGFPCQPYSTAGKRLGKQDERHLWPEMLRIIREASPTWVVGENVRGLVSWNAGLVFKEVQTDLEAQGYEVQPFLLPAAGVDAPHERYRIWFVAFKDTNSDGRDGELRQIKPGDQQFRNAGTGNNEWVSANHEKTPIASNLSNSGIEDLQKQEINADQFVNASNTTDIGFQTTGNPRNRIARFEDCDKLQHVANTNGIGFWSENNGGGKSVFINQNGPSIDWRNFPTQSPICIGNDGFSDESLRQFIQENCHGLLSEKEINKIISKSNEKWKEEVIMAAGNAVVPQVVMQIFKAIELFNQTYTT